MVSKLHPACTLSLDTLAAKSSSGRVTLEGATGQAGGTVIAEEVYWGNYSSQCAVSGCLLYRSTAKKNTDTTSMLDSNCSLIVQSKKRQWDPY